MILKFTFSWTFPGLERFFPDSNLSAVYTYIAKGNIDNSYPLTKYKNIKYDVNIF